MSSNDMLIPYNYSNSSPTRLEESLKLPSVFEMETPSSGIEDGMDDYHPAQRSNLKRKSDSTDYTSSSKVRAMSGGVSDSYSSSPSLLAPTSGPGREKKAILGESTSPQIKKSSTAGKRKKNDLTLEWLEENYTICDGVCLARCILYSHYRDFCEKNGLEPACAATFGKTIRQKFPRVTTRRLGTRGHSKYHYYGIGIRETSIYYNSVYAGKGLTRYSPKVKPEDETFFSSRNGETKDKTHTFLEDVPNVNQFNGEIGTEGFPENMQVFLNMYKCFCGKILEAAQLLDLNLLSTNLLQLWSDLPFEQFPGLVHSSVVMDLVSFCDVLLYQALMDVLLPTPCDDVNERQLLEIGNSAKQWDEFLKSSVPALCNNLLGKKRMLAQNFSQSMLRHVSFIKLRRAVRAIFSNASTFLPMQNDLDKISLQNSIGSQSLYSGTEENKDLGVNNELLKDLKELLKKNPTVESLIEWLDSIVDAKVIKPSKQNGRSMKKRAQDFLLKWSFFGARITHNLNNTNAISFNSFHYLRMFLVEYVMLAIETQFNNEKYQEVRRTVTKHIKTHKSGQHSAIAANNQGLWLNKANYYTETEKLETGLKANQNGGGISRRLDSYGCWPPGGGYETFSKSELPMPSHPLHYDAQHATGYPSYPPQAYSAINYNALPYSNSYLEQSVVSDFSQKRETVVCENGATFTYLNGTLPAKPEAYRPYCYTEKVDEYNSDYSSGSITTVKESCCKHGGLESNKYTLEHPSYYGTSDFLKVPASNMSRSPHYPCSTKMELSPVGSMNDSNSASHYGYSDKQKDGSFKDNFFLIQDLTHPYHGQNQNNYTSKNYPENSPFKFDHKLQHNGFRVGEESITSAPSGVSSFASPYSYNEFVAYDGSSPDTSNILQQSYNDDAIMWSASPPTSYLDKMSSHSPVGGNPGHPTSLHENLPSISSVLSTE